VKYKKCCGAGERVSRGGALRPRYEPGAERDPTYWLALKAARNRFVQPDIAWEDPRTTAALLGFPQGPGFDARRPPTDADFDWLVGQLERRAGAGCAGVWLRAAGSREEIAFAVPFDRELTAAIKRLPDRRFDAAERVWIVPAVPRAAAPLEALLDDHPWLTITQDVADWLDAGIGAWSAIGTIIDHTPGPVFVVLTTYGTVPSELEHAAAERSGMRLLLRADAAAARLLREHPSIQLDAPAEAAIAALQAGEPLAGATLELGRDEEGADRLELRADWSFQAAEAFAQLPECTLAYQREEACSYAFQEDVLAVPADAALVAAVRELLGAHPEVVVADAAASRLARLEAERDRAEATIALSLAHDAELSPIEGLGGELRPFQRAAVRYALAQRRTFLADEQGLGKTVEALAALQADGAFPAAVVCPASMKLVWQRECERWIPGRSVAVVHGRGEDGWSGSGADDADVVVCNYDILEAHADRLAARGLRAAVFDESHYCKDPRAKRTKAAIGLGERVAGDGLRLALTGTPILNRPKDLVAQLRLVGRLGDFGSGAGLGRRFRGAKALERLHWNLRAQCYVRRTKADVLPQLPAKRFASVPVELDNAAEYRLAEADVVAWLRTLPLDLRTLQAKVAAALRAEQLARLNYLRRLAARGKLRAAVAWIEDFVASGEPLVVFAHHREVQRALVERFPGAAHVLGDDDLASRAAAVEDFQRPDGPPLIVCSLQAASQGITLVRSSNVAFLELDWTPARHDQAEDRCHRIGQHDAVTAYYLLASQTIDEQMAGVLQRKRGLIDAVTDGTQLVETSALDAVVQVLRDDSGSAWRAAA
jgi:SWI/SNF-related matrix-associated actin-dependent regulator 1 of chromatin subfamily A